VCIYIYIWRCAVCFVVRNLKGLVAPRVGGKVKGWLVEEYNNLGQSPFGVGIAPDQFDTYSFRPLLCFGSFRFGLDPVGVRVGFVSF